MAPLFASNGGLRINFEVKVLNQESMQVLKQGYASLLKGLHKSC